MPRAGSAVYFLWHFPWGRPRRALPGTVPPWSPDFPLPARRRRAAVRPSGNPDLASEAAFVKGASDNARGHGLVVMPTAAANSFFTFPPNSGLTRRVVLPA